MPIIRISTNTMRRLKAYAIPLTDSVDDVVSRVLDAADKQRVVVTDDVAVRVLGLVDRGLSDMDAITIHNRPKTHRRK